MRKQLPAIRAVPSPVSVRAPLWRSSAVALATALLLGAAAGEAHALALGRVTVQSALGEPLRADIDVPQITPEEVETLRVGLAAPDAFRAAGLEFNPSLVGAQVTLQRRADGSYFLRLSSERPVQEPFLELMVETQWSSGRIVRDFTVLLDPPHMRPVAPLAAQVAPARGSASAGVAAARAPAAPSPDPGRAPVLAPRPQASPRAEQPAALASVPQRIEVPEGETAGRIAQRHRPPTVSLDQMLVALLRGNPDAFIDGNMNRLKAGSLLDLPTAAAAAAIAPAEARRVVIAQSRDFNEFRRQLAVAVGSAPQLEAASRAASGRVQAQVQDKTAPAGTPDRLTLSKGSIQGLGSDSPREDRIAQERSAREEAARLAELNRNIADLQRLSGATLASAEAATPSPATAATAATAGAPNAGPATGHAPGTVVGSSPGETSAAAGIGLAAAAAQPAPATPVAAQSAPAAPAQGAPVGSDWLQSLVEQPLLPAAGGGALALLLGLLLYRMRRRHHANQVDSSFLESRLQPDSFFGASGGQRIDTAENTANNTASSMVYSPSQLDAAGDVDPVAEADVYLAYGRDLQAEEILKEALRTNPQRIAIHTKLLEIHARRAEPNAFEELARQAHALTRGNGPEWRHIAAMGQELDPNNPLYRTAGQQAPAMAMGAAGAAVIGADYLETDDDGDEAVEIDAPVSGQDLDLDLDFLESQPIDAVAEDLHPLAAALPIETATPLPLAPSAPADLPALAQSTAIELPDLELDDTPVQAIAADEAPAPALDATDEPAAPASAAPAPAELEPLTFDFGDLSLDLDAIPAARAARSEAAPEVLSLESLEAASEAPTDAADAADAAADPLQTKFSLAEEFLAIGDSDGARSLAEEVLAEASGELKQRVQQFLADIG